LRVYADSSFILRLVTIEAGSDAAMTEHRRLDHPRLFFSPIHALEVRNAILQRAFHERRSISGGDRRNVTRQRDAALERLERFLKRGTLLDVTLKMEAVFTRAAKLSITHTERVGARAIDILHVAAALTLESELFLTTDERQAQLAKAEGLKVHSVC